jgi:hypothetical protein
MGISTPLDQTQSVGEGTPTHGIQVDQDGDGRERGSMSTKSAIVIFLFIDALCASSRIWFSGISSRIAAILSSRSSRTFRSAFWMLSW